MVETRSVYIDASKQEGTFNLNLETAGTYDVMLESFTSDKSASEQTLIWKNRTGQPFSSAWQPDQMTGLELWLDASDLSTLTLTNITVDAWASKVGSISGTAPSVANSPEYDAMANGGRGAVVFDQSDPVDKQFLNFGDVLKSTSATGLTIMAVFQVRETGLCRTFSKWDGASDNSWLLTPTTNVPNRILYRSASTNFNASNSGTPDLNFHIHGAIYDNGTASNIRSFYDSTASTATSITPSATASSENVFLSAPITAPANMSACEVLAFLRPLSTFERQVIEGYLAHKWGTVQFLPANHPFKSSPPAYIENLRSIAYAPSLNLFAATANTGVGNRILTSGDGIQWTTRASPEDNSWECIAWSEEVGAFVALAQTGTNRAMRSTDGITWTIQTITTQAWQDILWVKELARFYAVASSGSDSRVSSSPDGITWTTQATQDATTWRSIAYSPTLGTGGQGRLVVIGAAASDRSMTSDDGGATWIVNDNLGVGGTWQTIAYSPVINRFVAMRDDTTTTRVAYSDDGLTWTVPNLSPTIIRATKIIWNDELGIFIAPSSQPAVNVVWISKDGETWSAVSVPSNPLFAISYGQGKYIAVGDNGAINTSFAGHEQKSLHLELDELNTGDGFADTIISDTANHNIVNIHYARTYLSGRVHYRVRDNEGFPVNRKLVLTFQVQNVKKNQD